MTLPPLTAYVHYPWCVRKCPYCDFNSHPLREDSNYVAYTDALIADTRLAAARTRPRPLRSIFFGGGTPSLCPPQEVQRFLSALEDIFGFHPRIEITLEANPGTVDETHFRGFRQAGVNRLSLGVQSFDDAMLAKLGRIHDGTRARTAITAARNAGFDNLNIDLMHGLPGQTAEGARHDLEQALEFAPEHLSWYELTLEPQTEFARHPPQLPDEETLAAIERTGSRLLRDNGFRNYEISAWAQPRRRAQHNLNYWRYGDFIGLGAGAHAKITLADGEVRREVRQRAPGRYLATAGTAESLTRDEVLAEDDRIAEFLLNTLRLHEGFRPAQFEQRTGLGLQRIAPGVKEATDLGLLTASPERLRPTARGRRHLNRLLTCFAQV